MCGKKSNLMELYTPLSWGDRFQETLGFNNKINTVHNMLSVWLYLEQGLGSVCVPKQTFLQNRIRKFKKKYIIVYFFYAASSKGNIKNNVSCNKPWNKTFKIYRRYIYSEKKNKKKFWVPLKYQLENFSLENHFRIWSH